MKSTLLPSMVPRVQASKWQSVVPIVSSPKRVYAKRFAYCTRPDDFIRSLLFETNGRCSIVTRYVCTFLCLCKCTQTRSQCASVWVPRTAPLIRAYRETAFEPNRYFAMQTCICIYVESRGEKGTTPLGCITRSP